MRRSSVAKGSISSIALPTAKPQAVSASTLRQPAWIRLRWVSPVHVARAGSSRVTKPWPISTTCMLEKAA